jgi:hypothetical protein
MLFRKTPAHEYADFDPLDGSLPLKRKKSAPHQFVLDAIADLSPRTRPMFGCTAVYIEEKIVMILRDKPNQDADNGVWIATALEHHDSLRPEFPNMRSVRVFGKKVTDWQVLPIEAPDFEEAAMRACELILAGDPRIGKVPGAKRASRADSAQPKKKVRQNPPAKRSRK